MSTYLSLVSECASRDAQHHHHIMIMHIVMRCVNTFERVCLYSTLDYLCSVYQTQRWLMFISFTNSLVAYSSEVQSSRFPELLSARRAAAGWLTTWTNATSATTAAPAAAQRGSLSLTPVPCRVACVYTSYGETYNTHTSSQHQRAQRMREMVGGGGEGGWNVASTTFAALHNTESRTHILICRRV